MKNSTLIIVGVVLVVCVVAYFMFGKAKPQPTTITTTTSGGGAAFLGGLKGFFGKTAANLATKPAAPKNNEDLANDQAAAAAMAGLV